MDKGTARQYLNRLDLAAKVMRKAMQAGDVDAMQDAMVEINGCAAELEDYIRGLTNPNMNP